MTPATVAALEDVIGGLSELHRWTVEVSRLEGATLEPRYAETFPADGFGIELLKPLGPGQYQIRFKLDRKYTNAMPNGMSATYRAGIAALPPTLTGPVSSADGIALAEMRARLESQTAMLGMFLPHIVGTKGAGGDATTTALAIVSAIEANSVKLPALLEMAFKAVPKASGGITEMLATMAALREFAASSAPAAAAGAGGGGESDFGAFLKVLQDVGKPALELAAEAMRRKQDPAPDVRFQPHGVHDPAPAPRAITNTSERVDEFAPRPTPHPAAPAPAPALELEVGALPGKYVWVRDLVPFLPLLLAAARGNKPPEVYAELALVELSPAQLEQLDASHAGMAADAWAAEVLGVLPQVSAPAERAWLSEFLIAIATAEDAAADDGDDGDESDDAERTG